MNKKTAGLLFIFYTVFFFVKFFSPVLTEPVEDKQALLNFLDNITHTRLLNWNQTTSVCRNWTGVFCNVEQSRVIAVRLPGAGLLGPIPANTLSRLSALQTLSLRLNALSGPFPPDFSKLGNLNSIYLQHNKLSGPLPPHFSVWKSLSVIDLSNNAFNGSIPSSLSNLTHLTALNLSRNSLSGELPDLNFPSLQQLDLSNNKLTGPMPRSLQRFPSWAFSGNNLTAENALPPALSLQQPTAQPSKRGVKISESAILGIVIGTCVAIFAIVAVLMIIFSSKRGNNEDEAKVEERAKRKEASGKKKRAASSEIKEKSNSITFFPDCSLAFDLEDLLRASAEILGKGSFGTSYKAALEDTTIVVVKRLKEGNISKREFEIQMELVGNIKHENVDPLRGYYYSKEEKLMVYDYHERGSISTMLHGRSERGRSHLDWETRIRIAIGAAKGLAHIHGRKIFHGNIRASNIFLNSEGYGCISDIGLATLINPMVPPVKEIIVGYRAPEMTDIRKSTHSSDVYSFGVLILELLTGKSPVNVKGGDEVVHLVRWVNSVVREEWTGEVFAVELLRYQNIEEEMVEMLQVGLACVAKMPEQRPKMVDVVSRIEQVRHVSPGNRS